MPLLQKIAKPKHFFFFCHLTILSLSYSYLFAKKKQPKDESTPPSTEQHELHADNLQNIEFVSKNMIKTVPKLCKSCLKHAFVLVTKRHLAEWVGGCVAVERGGGGGGGLRRALRSQCACQPAGPAVQRPTGAALMSVTPVLVACLRLLTCAVHPAAARSSCPSMSVDTSLLYLRTVGCTLLRGRVSLAAIKHNTSGYNFKINVECN